LLLSYILTTFEAIVSDIVCTGTVLCYAAVLVSFANGLAQPLRVAEATEASNGGGVIQIIPDGHVGTISLAGQ